MKLSSQSNTIDFLINLIKVKDDNMIMSLKHLTNKLIEKFNKSNPKRNNYCAKKISFLWSIKDSRDKSSIFESFIRSSLEMKGKFHLLSNELLDKLKAVSLLLGIKIDLEVLADRAQTYYFGNNKDLALKLQMNKQGKRDLGEIKILHPNSTIENNHNYLADRKIYTSSYGVLDRIDLLQNHYNAPAIQFFNYYLSLYQNKIIYKSELRLIYQHLDKPKNHCINCSNPSNTSLTCGVCDSENCLTCLSATHPKSSCFLCASPLKPKRQIKRKTNQPAPSFKFYETPLSNCRACQVNPSSDLSFCSVCGYLKINPDPVLCANCKFFLAEDSSNNCGFCLKVEENK